MSSQRNRPRGQNRNSEAGGHGEEVALWEDSKSKLNSAIDAVNQSSQNVKDIIELEKTMAEKREKGALTQEDFVKLDNAQRKGVKVNDVAGPQLTQLINQLEILRAVTKAKEREQGEPVSGPRSGSHRNNPNKDNSSAYDFDNIGDSSVSSPNPGARGGRNTKDRDSVPPRGGSVRESGRDRDRDGGSSGTPVPKAGSAEPQSGSAPAMRSKVTFSKDDEVAFKPKPTGSEQTDWILGIVQEVRGEGKARRYRVLDADVDESGNQKDFRTSASNMIPIPKEGGPTLPPLENGKVVLALYPNTTTFYKAEVMGMDDGKVSLKFEGEESGNTLQPVNRRHVVEYRG